MEGWRPLLRGTLDPPRLVIDIHKFHIIQRSLSTLESLKNLYDTEKVFKMGKRKI